ncbi:MAG: phage terminase small subunit P27 family [Defluviitaleaceae bacterium]|nr:phage terminase small subunit P27 family [Defluviitaleaceae bacterium]
MAGRNREPVALLQAKGRKHLTKAEIDKRKKSEVTAPSDNIAPPAYLPARLKKEFVKIAEVLHEIGIITNLDVGSLAGYVIAQDLYIKVSKQLLKAKVLDKDLVTLQDKYFKQCRAAAADLGLTISSRCKLVMPTPKEVPVENPFARFTSSGKG